MNTILFALWFFLPAGIANMTPVFAEKLLPQFNQPLDLGLSFAGKRIFGDHKTIRGIVIGILFGIITAIVQFEIVKNISWFHTFIPFDYMLGMPVVFGLFLSVGALLGDAIKSFFKRRVGIASGKTWFPLDQIDYILGGILTSLFLVEFDWTFYLTILILYFLLHLASTTIGYFLGLKKSAL